MTHNAEDVRCCWDWATPANPYALECGRPVKWEMNGPNGYFVCGIHKRVAERIGDKCTARLDGDAP